MDFEKIVTLERPQTPNSADGTEDKQVGNLPPQTEIRMPDPTNDSAIRQVGDALSELSGQTTAQPRVTRKASQGRLKELTERSRRLSRQDKVVRTLRWARQRQELGQIARRRSK